MQRRSLSRLITLAAVAGTAFWRVDATAQDFPTKPITIVVPYAAGTIADLIGRTLGNELTTIFKHPVIVDNRPGAYQIVAYNHVVRQPADGYTLMITAAPNVIPAALQKTLPNNGNADFELLGYAGAVQTVLTVNPSVQATNVQQFIDLLKANPGKYMFGSAGPGTPHHMALEQFNIQAGTKSVHVPYKSFQNVITDVVSGQVHYSFLPFSTVQFAKDGRLRILGTNGLRRDPANPDIRTLDEQGMKGFEASIKYFVAAPKGTPAAIVNRLNAAINTVTTSEAYASKFKALGGFETPKAPISSAQALQALVQEDDRYTKMVRDNRIQFD